MSSVAAPLADRLEKEGILVDRIAAEPGTDADAAETGSLARTAGATWIVADGYWVGPAYARALERAGAAVLLVDDLGEAGPYGADLVLNQNLHATEAMYADRSARTSLLLGPRFALLRREFAPWRGFVREIPERARRILITLGGSDPENLTSRVVRALSRYEAYEWRVLVGPGNPFAEEILAEAGRVSRRDSVLFAVDDLPALLAWSDLAVSAAGSTSWELAFFGVPFLTIAAARNQTPIAESLASASHARSRLARTARAEPPRGGRRGAGRGRLRTAEDVARRAGTGGWARRRACRRPARRAGSGLKEGRRLRVLLFANNRLGADIAAYLHAQGEEIVGVVRHPPSRRACGEEILAASGVPADRVLDASQLDAPATRTALEAWQPEIGVSVLFGYILRNRILSLFPRECVNLHPAFLPWNRGAYPNVWSIVERTPAGATLHYVDEGIDTGDIVAQKRVDVDPTDTGESLYRRLEGACVEVFREAWPSLREGRAPRVPQPAGGTFHRSATWMRWTRSIRRQPSPGRDSRHHPGSDFPPHAGAYIRHGEERVYLRLQLDRAGSSR